MIRKAGCLLAVLFVIPALAAHIDSNRLTILQLSKASAEENPSLTTNFRSIGTNTGILAGGDSSTASVARGLTTVTFSGVSLPATIGKGDKLTFDPAGINEVRYIISRDSATRVTLQSAVANDHAGGVVYTITRAYNTIQAWENDRDGNLVR